MYQFLQMLVVIKCVHGTPNKLFQQLRKVVVVLFWFLNAIHVVSTDSFSFGLNSTICEPRYYKEIFASCDLGKRLNYSIQACAHLASTTPPWTIPYILN